MFHLPLPVLEKILRPVIVYLFLVGFLQRHRRKRELAQLNPFRKPRGVAGTFTDALSRTR